MKKIFNYIFLAALLWTGYACQKETIRSGNGSDGELTFYSNVESMSTKALGNSFFETGHDIDTYIFSSKSPLDSVHYTYRYGADGIFRGVPGYRFPMDDSYISQITAYWPTQDIRDEGFISDQREYTDYQLADWLSATATVKGVMPTEVPVPLHFVRENCLLEFELAGQNAEGLDIMSLLIEIQIEGKATACWAYCGNVNGHAELILPAGTELKSTDGYLIGRLTVNTTDEYTIIFPLVDLILEAGKRYLVTLTPRGYDISGPIFIGGWSQPEHGIGIPFTPPVPDQDGDFYISIPQQLITMSYLMRHYLDPGITFDWVNRDYYITDDFEMTEEYAGYYIPVPRTLFSRNIYLNGAAITSIQYGDGKILELYE